MENVLLKRVNRVLAPQNLKLRKSRDRPGDRLWNNQGDFYLVDEQEHLIQSHVDLQQIARERNVAITV
jgi:hypothetical protein